MKKLIRVLVIGLLLLPMTGLAAEGETWDSLYAPKDIALSVGIGFGYGFSLVAYPGVEFLVHEFVISETVPLEFGVAAKGFVNWFNENDIWGDYGWLAFGGGGFGTVHFTFRGSDLDIPPFLEKVDFYSALGLVFTYFTYTGDWGTLSKYADTGLGFASYGGVSYFLKENLAIYAEGNYWGYGGGATIGALLKL